uniref:Rubis-subs-bind domain-containing protein n=1 Tax=Enterobius vermicularis TaxID=51028 RepID=A0A0N4UU56_ENTVE
LFDFLIFFHSFFSCYSGFTAASEEEIIQQFLQNRRCDDDVCKAMTFLSKMLAEKRVFGTKLMAETTVAGPNHSTYKNLPEEGIHYIAYVCRKVMHHRIPDEEQFWDVFRDVTRKLAARCRRVRHSRKNRCENAELTRLQDCAKEHLVTENNIPNLVLKIGSVLSHQIVFFFFFIGLFVNNRKKKKVWN